MGKLWQKCHLFRLGMLRLNGRLQLLFIFNTQKTHWAPSLVPATFHPGSPAASSSKLQWGDLITTFDPEAPCRGASATSLLAPITLTSPSEEGTAWIQQQTRTLLPNILLASLFLFRWHLNLWRSESSAKRHKASASPARAEAGREKGAGLLMLFAFCNKPQWGISCLASAAQQTAIALSLPWHTRSCPAMVSTENRAQQTTISHWKSVTETPVTHDLKTMASASCRISSKASC